MDITVEGDVDPLHLPYQIKNELPITEPSSGSPELFPVDIDDLLMNSSFDNKDEGLAIPIELTYDQSMEYLSTIPDDTLQRQLEETTDTYVGITACKICNKKLLHHNLSQHIKIVHGNTFIYCDHCEFKSKYKRSIIHHLFTKHFSSHNNYCHKCKKCFSNENKLTKHNLKYHPYICNLCKKIYTTIECLKLHIENMHNIEKSYCHICKIDFKNDLTLKMHIQFCHGSKIYQCTFCGKLFEKNAFLKSHLRSHSDIKPFKCKLCIKSYKYKRDFRIHLRNTHGFNITCSYCNFVCRNDNERLDHELSTHKDLIDDYGNEDYPCIECDIVFTNKLSLKQHFVQEHEYNEQP